jgi:hypothetical protein
MSVLFRCGNNISKGTIIPAPRHEGHIGESRLG